MLLEIYTRERRTGEGGADLIRGCVCASHFLSTGSPVENTKKGRKVAAGTRQRTVTFVETKSFRIRHIINVTACHVETETGLLNV